MLTFNKSISASVVLRSLTILIFIQTQNFVETSLNQIENYSIYNVIADLLLHVSNLTNTIYSISDNTWIITLIPLIPLVEIFLSKNVLHNEINEINHTNKRQYLTWFVPIANIHKHERKIHYKHKDYKKYKTPINKH